jgi:hypothetical protein
MAIQQTDSDMQPTARDSSERSSQMLESKEGAIEVDPVEDEYPHGARLAVIVLSLMLGMFLVALDNVSNWFS